MIRTDCRNVGNSPFYRRLCHVLSVIPPNQRSDYAGFTGQRDTDLELLTHFTDEELINVCATNRYINTLCQNDYIWKYKTLEKFGALLGDATSIAEKYIPEGTTWKEYYIWLSGMQEADPVIVFQLAISSGREDLLAILSPEYLDNIPEPVAMALGAGILHYVTDNLRDFFREANLGPSDPHDPYSIPLAEVIDFRIMTRLDITKLFVIYEHVNQMQQDPFNPQRLTATPLMHRYFAEDFAQMPGFDPNNFRHGKLLLLAGRNLIPNDQLTQEQRDTLTDPDVIRYAQTLSRYLASIDYFYKIERQERRRRR